MSKEERRKQIEDAATIKNKIMAQEDKDLLFKDFCARLPYKLKVKVPTLQEDAIFTLVNICEDYITVMKDNGSCFDIYNSIEVFPFLRPMSSMTEEEKQEIKQISTYYLDEWLNAKTSSDKWKIDAKVSYMRSVFYNSHHIDWNGLIEKGLALEASKDMYK